MGGAACGLAARINKVRYLAADGEQRFYYYHRASGSRLAGEPGSPEFIASFQEAGRSAAQNRSVGTVSWLIRQYCDSQQWKKLADSTKSIGLLNLKAVEAKWGTTPLKHVENPRSRALFLRWHDSLAEVQRAPPTTSLPHSLACFRGATIVASSRTTRLPRSNEPTDRRAPS